MPLRVGFDMDGVLVDFVRGFTMVLNEMYGTRIIGDDEAPNWNFEDYLGLTKKQVGEAWNEIGKRYNWWQNLSPTEHPDLIHEIIQNQLIDTYKCECFFVTHRTCETPGNSLMLQCHNWLRYTCGILYPNVIVCHWNKGVIMQALRMNYFIDDKPQNCAEILHDSPNTKIVMRDNLYNRDITIYPKVKNISEYYRFISSDIKFPKV